MNILRKILHIIPSAMLFFSGLSAQAEDARLITDVTQISGLTDIADVMINPAVKEGSDNVYDSSFEVALNNPVVLSQNQGMLMYIGRKDEKGAPTLVMIEGKGDTGDYEILSYARFQYRGAHTYEFSEPIYAPASGNMTVKHLKVTVLKVELPAGNSEGFSLYKLNFYPYTKGELYPDGRKDPFRYDTDYYTGFLNFKYEPNRGILDPRNNYNNNWGKYPTETPWGADYKFRYEGEEYELPTFDKQGGGQMPHVTEHTLYAMPGDVISLSPYYDLPTSKYYTENYSHWYGYNPRNDNDELQDQDYHHLTDSKGNRLLDFLIDPADMLLTSEAGFFAGTKFPKIRDRYLTVEGKESYIISTPAALMAFANLVNSGEEDLNAILVADIDCSKYKMTKIGGVRNKIYTGRFDGNGHTIKNVTLSESSSSYNTGIFGAIGGGAEIINLKVENANIQSGGRAGVLVGAVYSNGESSPVNIENVFVNGTVKTTAIGDITIDGSQVSLARAGGVIGYIDNNNSAFTVNLKNVAFVGDIKGGYGSETCNAALIGCTGNSKVTVTNCYADAFVQNATEGMAAVANGDAFAEGQLAVTNSYIKIGTPKGGIFEEDLLLPKTVYQNGFQGLHTTFKTQEDQTGIFTLLDKKYVIGGFSKSWNNPHLWMWNSGGNIFQGAFPGPAVMEQFGNLAYYEFTEEEWENLFQKENLGLVFSGSEYTGNLSINDYGKENYIFSDLSAKGKTPVINKRAVFVRNEDGINYYLIAVLENGNTQFTQPINTVTINETGSQKETYSVFNIPEDWNGKYSISIGKYIEASQGLPDNVSVPIEIQANCHRIYVSFDISSTEFYCHLRAGYNNNEGNWISLVPEDWVDEFKKLENFVIINGKQYFYIDIPEYAQNSATGEKIETGVTFCNSDKSVTYESVLINYNGKGNQSNPAKNRNMILDVHADGTIDGALFIPTFFEYGREGLILYAQYNNEHPNVLATAFELDGKKYSFINRGVSYKNKPRFTFDKSLSQSAQLMENTWQYECQSGHVHGYTYLREPVQLYIDLPETKHYVYPNCDFYKEVLAEGLNSSGQESWTINDSGIFVPPMKWQIVNVPEGEEDFETVTYPSHEVRWYGTEATFYHPLKTDKAPDDMENLVLEKPEYHIAADFAHDFNDYGDGYNIDHEAKIIHEPVINFRHIFHVKDGKKFADDNTSSPEKNEKFVNNNSRAVSARAGYDFQVRLNQQVPLYKDGQTYSQTRTNFYYKKGENLYERVPRVGIVLIDENGNEKQNNIFEFDARVRTQGMRFYPEAEGFAESDTVFTANGGGEVYRALYCKADNANAGTYKVRLKALNFDGSEIKVFGSATANLYLDEYVVTFLDAQSASLLTESQLKEEKYEAHRAEYLEHEDVCGPPAVVVDFDQFRVFESAPYRWDDYFISHRGMSGKWSLKWPLPWKQSTYSFAYGEYLKADFNEYTITNHSDETGYNAAAGKHRNDDGSYGLYDRLYYDTYAAAKASASTFAANQPEVQKGYFYYVNAASDPGVAATLTINNLCPGSTVAVSAWVAEMSLAREVANLCFNFVAVDRDGNREIVHSFITGYIDQLKNVKQDDRIKQFGDTERKKENQGEWMHVYYSFIPDLSSIQNLTVDHYELELENNCVSSSGADYAVDDIRAYIISPAITARQLNPVCDASQNTVGIRISSRFDKLLVSNGLTESTGEDAGETLPLYFAVLDKKKYDELYKAAEEGLESGGKLPVETLAGFVEAATIAMSKPGEDGKKSFYTRVDISTNFEKMDSYEVDVYNKAFADVPASGVRFVRTNILPYDTDLRPGKDYYIVLYAPYFNSDEGSIPEPTYSDFAISGDPCEKFAVMTLQGSGIIKIDGIAYNSGDPIEVCYGQRPVVQVDLQMLKDGEELEGDENYGDFEEAGTHYYDWFIGSVEEFMASREGNQSYYDLLYIFRYGSTPDGNAADGDGDLDAVKLPDAPEAEAGSEDKYEPLRRLVEEGRLVLHTSSYVFPRLKKEPTAVDEEGNEDIRVLTAMPIMKQDDEETHLICSQPNEIRLRVVGNAPLMADGFVGITDYPDEDVPVRVGLRQLRSVGKLTLSMEATEVDGLKKLELPLRGLRSYKVKDDAEETEAEMTMSGNRNVDPDPYVYLVESNDPAYIGLDQFPDGTALENTLLPVGMVAGLNASTGTPDVNCVNIVFYEDMKFNEGYYYRVRFAFDEVIPTEVEGYCEGHVVFTIKVVPEYAKWTGADSRNWNNDSNWSRVTPDDILLPADNGNDENLTSKINDFTVGGANDNAFAYAPLDFTKVLVEQLRKENVSEDENAAGDVAKGYPRMFTPSLQSVNTLHDSKPWNSEATDISIENMAATADIQYDMVSLDIENGPLAVRPWYANTCEQIHFNHGAEMTHQEHFKFGINYQKAWVDMEITGDRWYTLASPLQGTVAGDMYTKTAKGIQDNELFTHIRFNETDYGRYQPAVYQRGWNKATANVYRLGEEAATSVAVNLNWSRVYNDVGEDYAPGLGYSIRTVTDGITDVATDKTVRFRLPKADDSYSYFTNDESKNGHNTTVNRNGESRHALTSFTDGEFLTTLTIGTAGKYFLAGNPFMASMDMAKFLKENEDVIERAYWIMNSDRQQAALWDEANGTFITTDDTESVTGVIAPMQGFFVKAKGETLSTELDLRFTPDMIVENPLNIEGNPALRSTRSGTPSLVTVTALDAAGAIASRAIIRVDDDATNCFDASEDVSLLLDASLDSRSTVYTVASDHALAINSLGGIMETEVGLLAPADEVNTLVFSGIDESDGLKLLDTASGKTTDLYDGMTVEVEGSASGRFYIIGKCDLQPDQSLTMILNDRTLTVAAPEEGIWARVYTPAGICIGEWSGDDSVLQFDMDPGIVIVEARTRSQRLTRKYIVK